MITRKMILTHYINDRTLYIANVERGIVVLIAKFQKLTNYTKQLNFRAFKMNAKP